MSLMAANEESDPSAILNGFWVTLFKVVPPGIVLYLQVAVYHHFSEKEKG